VPVRTALLVILIAASACIRQPVAGELPSEAPVSPTTAAVTATSTTTVPAAEPILVAADQRYLSTFAYDVWIPADPNLSGAIPLVVLLHGGGPAGRRALEPLAIELARHDIAVMNAGYAPPGRGGQFPGPFLAATCATALALSQAESLGADPDRVFVVGYSFGAVAAAVAVHSGELFTSPDCPAVAERPLAGWVGISGPYDLDLLAAAASDAMVSFFGGDREARTASWTAADPYSYPTPSGLPAVLIHGTADPEVPVSVTDEYRAWLTDAGDTVQLVVIDEGTHLSVIDPTSATAAVDAIVAFVQRPIE